MYFCLEPICRRVLPMCSPPPLFTKSKGAPKPAEVAFVLSTNDSLQFKKASILASHECARSLTDLFACLTSSCDHQGSGTSSDEELRISGKFTSTVCHLSRPLTGELVIEVRMGALPFVHLSGSHSSTHLSPLNNRIARTGWSNRSGLRSCE